MALPRDRGCRDASRERLSAPNLQRKMLKATPTWESTQNPQSSQHPGPNRVKRQGRMGNTGIKAFYAVHRAVNGIQMSRPAHPAAGSQRKHIPLPAAGAAQPTTPREPWGRCLTIWAAHCQGKLPGCGEEQGRRTPLTQHGSWHAKGMDGSAPSVSCHQEVTLQPGTAY